MKKLPYHLSDPEGDFTSEQDRLWLSATIAKQGVGLTHYDLLCIFQMYLPAGTYTECLYYLPIAFDYILNQEIEISLLESILFFLDKNQKELEKDCMWSNCVEKLKAILQKSLNVKPSKKNNLQNISDAAWEIFTLFNSQIGSTCLWRDFEQFGKINIGYERATWEFIVLLVTVRSRSLTHGWDEQHPEMSSLWSFHFPTSILEKLHKRAINQLRHFEKKADITELDVSVIREIQSLPTYYR